MKRRPWPWATDDVYGGTPTQATKVPPSISNQEEGYDVSLRVPPTIWNFMRWQYWQSIIDAHSMQALNWLPSEGPVPVQSIVKVAGYDAGDDVHTLFLNNRPIGGVSKEIISYGGLVWTLASTGGLPAGDINDFVANQDRYRVALINAADSVYFSVNVGAWANWTGGYATPGNTYDRVENRWDPSGSGYAFSDTSALMYYSLVPVNPITGAAADPGFSTPPVVDIHHSHHYAGLLWPDDAGNSIWMVMTTDELSTSLNGTNWTSAAIHGMDLYGAPHTAPCAFGYSAYGTKWIAIIGRNTAGKGTIAYSENNGGSWIRVDDAIPSNIRIDTATIDCDLFGNWVVSIADLTAEETQYYGSFDNGETWYRLWPESVYFPAPYIGGSGGFMPLYGPLHYVWYGGGRFHIASSENNDPSPSNISVFHSLRAAE